LFDDDDDEMVVPVDPDLVAPEADEEPLPDVFDQYISANILVERQGEAMRGTVMRRAKDAHSVPVGKPHKNPLLDTREWEVEYPDGTVDVLTANAIAEALYSRVDAEGHEHMLLQEILEHKFDGNLLSKDDMHIQGTNRLRRTTKGCKLLVSWKDGSTDWIPLADMKESYPVQVAEYAVNNKIVSESCFAWWVPHVINKRDRIIKAVKGRVLRRTHKFGIEVPKSVKHALELDEQVGTTFWADAINKEMRNVCTAFDIRHDGKIPAFHKEIRCHMIFDVKAETLQRKARFVAGGHLTDPPKDTTYSSVVSRDSVRLFFLIAALNDLDVSSCDVQNAYINAPTKEKVWFRAGPELGEHAGKVVVIVRALYGLKSSGARFREHMAGTLRNLGFVSTKADPDVWIRSACKSNGDKVYEYVLCYVDDILFGGLDAKTFMKRLSDTYKLKEGSVKEPDKYLGADISKHTVNQHGVEVNCYSMSSDGYLKQALKVVEDELALVGKSLKRKAPTPMASGYRPELDATPYLNPDRASYFMSLMGILRWAIELGRIDIMVEAGLLSRFQAAPREGHLEQMFHIMAYLKQHNHSRLVFDHSYPTFTGLNQNEVDWQEYYPGAAEPIPPNMPEPRGPEVSMTCFVDADHAGCKLTRRSHTGVVIFVNRAPILWFSKRQATVESSTFGSESVAMRQAIDMIEGLRYKLRMMGVPIAGSTQVFCDNDAVVKSTTRPESTLKKKHNAINYHRIREAQAAGHINITWVESGHNLADVLTKVLTGEKRRELIRRILYP
jgi:Reverse transcriptase (RNA-dependent DNA polymerase)